ncbi:nuclease-related domain-containing protein [Thioalkalivibrio sp. XN8]|uniref:nuclease-related domain-containing protein n=1 Tax=Thioalkalivibrio sp. XN8 TaxID=2712863 RepID=UPI001F0E0A31|nr:nuclease-related domain-containing protein [Thioalkalivibrio sp. XN8]
MDKLVNEKVLSDYFIAMFMVLLAGLEWFRWYTDMRPQPVIYTVVAIIVAGVAFNRIRRNFKRFRALKLGQEGEAAVGQFLESLRNRGASVLHDFPGEGFNVDHIVIHESGVYLIETKTFSKPDRGEPLITFDGERVLVLGREPDRNPVIQARASARWLSELIQELTGKRVAVRPVVVFPG